MNRNPAATTLTNTGPCGERATGLCRYPDDRTSGFAEVTDRIDEVAEAIARAVDRKKDVIYVRRIWAIIVLIILNIPERVCKRMKI